jgi:hypothetical protein
LKEKTILTCPDCGEELAMIENSTLVCCPGCKIVRFIISGQPGEAGFGVGSAPAITIHTLSGEVRELEKQLLTLVDRWGVVDLFRNIGFILVLTGIGYAILSSLSNFSLLTYGVYAMLGGIILHAAIQLVGRDYYIQKAFLEELILIKQHEIEQQRSGALKTSKIS